MIYDATLSHPDDITDLAHGDISPRRHRFSAITHEGTLGHPGDITKYLALGIISSGPLMANAIYHLGHFRCYHMSSRWYNEIWNLCHPDNVAPGWPIPDAVCHAGDLQCNPVAYRWHNDILNSMPSGWFSSWRNLIRMNYGPCTMYSGWHTMLL